MWGSGTVTPFFRARFSFASERRNGSYCPKARGKVVKCVGWRVLLVTPELESEEGPDKSRC